MPSLREPSHWSMPTLETASGCFETMRVYEGQIFRLHAHLGRLYASATYLNLHMPLTPRQLGQRLNAVLARSALQEAVVRVAMIPNAQRIAHPSIVVQPVSMPTAQMYRRGIHVSVVPTRRFPIGQIDPQAKFSARLGSVQAVMEAQLRGADEALFLDGLGGYVTESTASNLGMIKDGVFLAPPCWLGLLAGITWQVLWEAARQLRLPTQEVPLTRHDLYNGDEVFLTSTLKEILAVTQIDGRVIGTGKPGPQTQRLHRAFRAIVRRELHGHH